MSLGAVNLDWVPSVIVIDKIRCIYVIDIS